MQKTKRIFLAIKIQPNANFETVFKFLKKDLAHESIKWVGLNNMHLTLKFFGETPINRIGSIILNLEETLQSQQKFKLNIENIGVFGSSYQPRLIWAGITKEERLSALWENIRKQLVLMEYQNDRQNFVPHLTLGRIRQLKDKSLFQNIIKKHREIKLQTSEVNKIYLFESVLARTGPIYSIIHEFTFGA